MRARKPICLLFLVCQLLLVSGAHDLAEAKETVRIAAREDARPFIWKDVDTGHYLGFFWDICTEAVQRAGFRFKGMPINAKKRSAFMNVGTVHIDLLCDPTTITLERMRNFTQEGNAPNLTFSPIVFVANGTHAVQNFGQKGWGWGEVPEASEGACKALRERSHEASDPSELNAAGKAKQTGNTNEPWLTLVPKKRDETGTFEFRGYVKGTTIAGEVEREARLHTIGHKSGPVICTMKMNSHDEAAKEFCEGRIYRYYGDADIIKASLAAYRSESGASCANSYTIASGGTYEPYALVASSRNIPEFPELLALALYSMFSDGTMERLYVGHFPKTKKSEYLNTLFGVNAIPKGSAEPGKSVEAPEADASSVSRNSKVVSK